MNLTAIIFLITFGTTVALAFRRPSWAVATYLLTFFMAPPFWWWGSSLVGIRWNLLAGIILLGSVLISGAFRDREFWNIKLTQRLLLIVLLMAVNATAVHFLLAPNALISVGRYSILMKTAILFPLIVASIRTEVDVKIILLATVIGAMYIGYEVTINDRGRISGNRLEGVGVANASTANDLACLIVSVIPMVAPFFLFGSWSQKLLAVVSAPLILNVLLMCNSRGAFLALGVLGVVYLVLSPKKMRPKVILICCLGLFVGWLLLGDPRIVERFMTIFNESEDLDRSATSRFDFWRAGIMMIGDHPMGSGGNGFRDVYGQGYIAKVTGVATARSVHQGYINEACDWGIQGLTLRLSFLLIGLWLAFKTSRLAIKSGRMFLAATSLSIIAGISGVMVQSLFGTFLDAEWGLWFVAISAGCYRIVLREDQDKDEQEDWDESLDDPLNDIELSAISDYVVN